MILWQLRFAIQSDVVGFSIEVEREAKRVRRFRVYEEASGCPHAPRWNRRCDNEVLSTVRNLSEGRNRSVQLGSF